MGEKWMADEPLMNQTEMTSQLGDRISGLSPAKRALLELRLKEKLRTGGSEQTISRLARPDCIPASFAQQRLWLLHQLEPSSSAYSMTTTLRLKGRLNIAALEKSLNKIIRRHEVLRTTFALVDGQLTQVIDTEAKLVLQVLDLSRASHSHAETETQRIITEESCTPFDLEKGPLVRAVLLRMSHVEHIFLCLIHHIVSDGWSMGIFHRELSTFYEAFSNGKPSPFEELPVQYADFSVWQRKWLQGEVLEKQLSYWKHQLENAPPMLELPTDRPRPVIQTFRGASEGYTISDPLAHELRNLSRHNRVTLFMTLLAAFKILLQRYAGQDDIVVGSPIAGRNRAETEGLIGFFVNTLVLRTDLSGNPTFRDLLARVRTTALSAYAHQDLPFEKLVEELQPERDLSRTPLFQVFFNMLGLDGTDFELHGLAIERLTRAMPESKFDFTMYVREKDGNIHLRLVYNADLFDEGRMKEMMDQFQSLLSQIVKNPDEKIHSFSVITPKAKGILPDPIQPLRSDWLGAVHSRFSEQAERVPDRIALSSDKTACTYRELDSRSNQIANSLLASGIRPGDVVALYGHRAPSLVWGVLGILKAGAAFLILDPSYPAARIIDYLRIARPKGWIALQKAGPLSDDLDKFISTLSLSVRLELPDSPSAKKDNPLTDVSDSSPGRGYDPDDLAYIAFTSGTSGQPKAILGTHRPLSHFIHWHCQTFGLNETDRFSMLSGLSHDPLLRDIFTPLWLGATLCVPDLDRMSASELAVWINQQQITVAHLTPAMGELLTEHQDSAANPSLRFVFFGGDVLTQQHVSTMRRLAPSATCVNFYGATETPQAMGYFIVPSNQKSSTQGDEPALKQIVPLGKGIGDVQLLVLNACEQLAGVGEIGEIHVRTPYLARGYLGDEAMTQESFMINPLNRIAEDKVYRTGDLGRYSPAGLVEFAGRRDQQVKIRGFRVEPAEIEALLEKHPDIRHAVVQPQDSHAGHKRLVAYVVSKQDSALSSADLRSFLRKKLPEYMVPSAFMYLDDLPLTQNGKVDRRALPIPDGQRDLEETFVPARTLTEEVLVEIWSKVLRVEQIGIQDNFFDLGGHSLLAIQVISRVRESFQVEIPLRSFFQTPTVAALADSIETARRKQQDLQAPPLVPVSRNENLPLSFSQQRLWFLSQFEPESTAYNISRAIRLSGALNVEALQRALDTVVARHEILRTTIADVDGTPVQSIGERRPVQLVTIDLSKMPASERQSEMNHFLKVEAGRAFNLASDLMLRANLLRMDREEHVLFLITHHIASDGWSSGILLHELIALYKAFSTGTSHSLSELPIQYADVAVWQRQWLQGDVLEKQLSYWKRQLSGALTVLEIPSDRPRPSFQSFRGTRQSVKLSKELTEALKKTARAEEVTLFMILLAAFKTLLFRYSGQDDILVGVPVANRNRPELERLIGFFVNNLVLRTDLSGNPTFQELLRRVREVALGAYSHQDLPFEKLVEELQPARDMSHTPLFQVMFGFQSVRRQTTELPGVTLTSVPLESETARFDLFLSLVEDGDSIRGVLEYNTDIFESDTITLMLGHYQNLLEGVALNPKQRLLDLPMLTEKERHQLLVEWNDTKKDYPKEKCIHELFEVQVKRSPDAVAVVFEDKRLTYRELNRRANQTAHYLRKLGVGPEFLVGIYMERSWEMVVAVLGVLKAGGAYVPLDPFYPKERLSFMLEDAEIRVLLTQQRLAKSLPEHSAQTVCFDSEWEMIARESDSSPIPTARPENLAYVIYTSGSTGKPKGVQVLHEAVVNFLNSMRKQPGLTEQGVFAAVTTLSFDIAGLELFLPLFMGARVVLVDSQVAADGSRLAEVLQNSGTTVMQATPTTWQLLREVGWQPRDPFKVLCGGEALPRDLADYLLDRASSVWNMYGPTETTIWSATHEVESARNAIPVGRPIDNTQIYILDSCFNPVPVRVPGELYIGGAGLARGYRNRVELTAEKFVPDPFSDEPGARIYRTGDRARYLSNGNIEFLGRMDYQVKIRGFRIELGEIEAGLSQHPGISRAIVVDREISGDRRLIGYVIPKDEQVPSSIDLKEFLRKKLPDYMVPASFVFLNSLPQTPNGKVDRRALPITDGGSDSEVTFVAPRDAVELQLAVVWEQVLGLQHVGVRDNFFDIGGHSLLAVRLFARIEKIFGKRLPLALLFQAPTIEQLANLLRQEEWSPSWSSLVTIQPSGSKPPFFCVHAHRGNVLNFNDLSRCLGTNQPFYGLQAQGLDGEQPSHTRIEDMASHYLTEIRTVQPTGPYFLGGYCFGGKVALEMAHQLREQGEQVALVAMIDAYAPGGLKQLPWVERAIKLRFFYHWENIERLQAADRLRYILEKIKVTWRKSHTQIKKLIAKLYLRRGISLPPVFQEALPKRRLRPSYAPKIYPRKITVFSPTQGPRGCYHESHMGWGNFTAEGLEIYEIPGSSAKIIFEPSVNYLAEQLRACMDKATSNNR
jgi:amino acid adenylation domain-containing protein